MEKELPKVIRSGELSIGQLKIKVHILNNEQRIIEEESLKKILEWMENGTILKDDAEKFAQDLKNF
jgi:hypothetical protein